MATSISRTISSSTTTIILQEIDGTYGSPQIQSIRNGKETGLVFSALPSKDSDKAIGFDLFGVKREITINGVVAGSKSELQGFFVGIEGFSNGQQWDSDNKSLQLKIDFNTELSYNVLIKSFFWTWDKGSPAKLNYTMTLTEVDPNQGSS